ncbi:protein spinster homolog 1-like [Strigops habroptila]|uniref:protein spinster homolog 1-like n=1 Tax=Strigops habroptila TaxID=2489341 RepID=UPI0011CEE219|nr:protein spinster homolog 1-like [Strigops habroptila]
MASGPELLRADDTSDGGAPSCPTAPHSDGSCPTAPHSDGSCPTAPHSDGSCPIAPPGARLSIAILCYINLLNYMDRFTVAGVLPDVEDFFSISDSSSGLLQTVFIGSYMVLAPLCGYWGDRRSRKRLLSLGLALWAAATMAGSFVPPQVRRCGALVSPPPTKRMDGGSWQGGGAKERRGGAKQPMDAMIGWAEAEEPLRLVGSVNHCLFIESHEWRRTWRR